jgi:hypothetical protein
VVKVNPTVQHKNRLQSLKGIASLFTIARNSVYKAPDLTKSLVRVAMLAPNKK